MAEQYEQHEAAKSKERGCLSLGSSSDEDLDVEAFIDQEFDSIICHTDDEMSEMFHTLEEFEARTDDQESSESCSSRHLNGVSAQADGGFMVAESNASKEEAICSVISSSAEQRMEEVGNMYGCHKVCPQCKSPSRKSFHDTDETKSAQNGKGSPHGRDVVVSEEQISDISDDVGMCWKELGPKLRIKTSKIHNIDDEYKTNRDKANRLLLIWAQTEGCAATVGVLEAALLNINRRDIAETLLRLAGVTDMEPERRMSDSVFSPPLESLNLTVKCNLKANSTNPILLCVNEKGEKFLTKKIDGEKETPWDVMEILENEKLLEKIVTALTDRKKTKEQRRQESLKRASNEIEQLRKRLKRAKLDPDQDKKESEEIDKEKPEEVATGISKDDLETLLANCERQCDNLQGMFNGLIKVIGEVGPLEGNNRCLTQLLDFTKELQGQEKQFFPQIDDISLGKPQLTTSQSERLEVLQKWQRAQKEQVDGIEKLLTSLMNQGHIQRKKIQNRRSEPILGRLLNPSGARRRSKTDSAGTKSLSEIREENRKDNISGPLCPRQMCMLERQTVKAKTKSLPRKNS